MNHRFHLTIASTKATCVYLTLAVSLLTFSIGIGAEAERSSLAFGEWADQQTWQNNLLVPIQVTLKDHWQRVPPPGTGLFVLSTDGTVANQPGVEIDPADLGKAFVFWAEQITGFSKMTFGIEFYGPPEGINFDAFVNAHILETANVDARRPGMLLDPLGHRHSIWLAGRQCWQYDFDGFYASGGFHKRYLYIPAERHVVVMAWAMTDPTHRAAIDGWFNEMVHIGAPFQPTEKEFDAATKLLARLQVEPNQELLELQSKLTDAVHWRGHSVSNAQGWLTQDGGGGLFGIARNFGNGAGANVAFKQASHTQEKIDGLMLRRSQLQLTVLRKELDQEQREAVRHYFPLLAAHLDNRKSWRKFEPETQTFRIEFPGEPSAQFDGPEESYGTRWNNEEYKIVTMKFPAELVAQLGSLDALTDVIAQMSKEDGAASIVKRSSLTIDDLPAQEVYMTISTDTGGKEYLAMRFMLSGNSLFMVSVRTQTKAEGDLEKDIQHFFESFHPRA